MRANMTSPTAARVKGSAGGGGGVKDGGSPGGAGASRCAAGGRQRRPAKRKRASAHKILLVFNFTWYLSHFNGIPLMRGIIINFNT
ncbi:MAG TPA: hypothetical protein DEA73_09650 [Peptococcaceae bacterium]|nr:hypothetical protein [Peptococcaceae bacterium]